MPRITLESPHSLSRTEAVGRLKEKIDVVRDTYRAEVGELHEEWNDHTLSFGFKVMGMKVAGTVKVEASQVAVEAELPLAAMMFKGAIKEKIGEELGELLA